MHLKQILVLECNDGNTMRERRVGVGSRERQKEKEEKKGH